LGESLGGSILIQAAALEPAFRAIIAECPYAGLRAVAEWRTERILKLPNLLSVAASRLIVSGGMLYARASYGLNLANVQPEAAMAATRTPVMLIHGMKDDATPCWHSQRLAAVNAQAELWLVPGAGHVNASATDTQGFRTRVLAWFARH
jgi:pimeloyl-ACP methyl ester carboxylesterase